MKKIISIALALLFLYGCVGYFVAFRAKRYAIRKEIKHQIKQGVPKNELTTITNDITNSRLDWVKPGKEFRLNGKMYDVVSKRMEGNTVYYNCINDTQEEELFKNLDEQVNKQMNEDGNTDTKNTIKDYLPVNRISTVIIGSSYMLYPQGNMPYTAPPLELNTPPPPVNS